MFNLYENVAGLKKVFSQVDNMEVTSYNLISLLHLCICTNICECKQNSKEYCFYIDIPEPIFDCGTQSVVI